MATQVAFTAEQLARMPEDGLRHEIDCGELLTMTRPNSRHGEVQANLIYLIQGYVRKKRLGKVYTESGFLLGKDPDTLRGPNLAFVRADRVSDAAWPELAPDLVVEIVSPSETARQIDRKVHQYLAAGTLAVWIVYPETRSVYVYEPNGVPLIVEANQSLSSPAALPGFSLQVHEIFD